MKLDKGQISIIGAGTMGTGIAQIASTSGHETVLVDTNAEQLERSKAGLVKILDRQVEKRRMSREEVDGILDRISFERTIESTSNSVLIVEAIVEDLEVKRDLFARLESILDDSAVLATNTSSLSVTAISAACSVPERVVGMHFFNPAPLMSLVEIIPALDTSSDVVDSVTALVQSWGKSTVLVKDTPGFIVNRVARSYYSESLRIVDEGIATPFEVDHAMKTIGGFRMGPFELMDLIGNDINLKVTESVFAAFYQDPRYKPSFTQKRLVDAGRLGRKSGRGYYDYGKKDSEPGSIRANLDTQYISDRVVTMIMNEAIDAVFWGVASAADIDTAMTKGVNYPKGPIAWAEEVGLPTVLDRMRALRDKYSEDRYRASPLLKEMVSTGASLHG